MKEKSQRRVTKTITLNADFLIKVLEMIVSAMFSADHLVNDINAGLKLKNKD